MALTKADLIRADLYSWMLDKYVLPSKEKYSFTGYEYLIDIAKMRWPKGREVFIRKSAQSGISEWALALLLWMNDRNLPGWHGSGLVFPATKQLESHIKARLVPILESDYFNRKLTMNNLSFIQWNGKPIYFKGGQTRRDLISWPADLAILDEFDEFKNPMSVVPTIRKRLIASRYKWILGLSTPTHPDVGIDKAYGISTQHNYYIPCQVCSKKFSPLAEVIMNGFENCVDKSPITGVTGFLCPNCRELTRTNGIIGSWEVDVQSDSLRMGYSVSQLFTAQADLGELLQEHREGLNIQEFYNSSLGLPYAPADAHLSRAQIQEAAASGVAEIPSGSKEPTWLGVDVGLKCRWVVGVMRENGHKEVIAYGMCKLAEMKKIEEDYNVHSAVYDLRPYEQEVKRHIEGRRGFYACDFNTGNQQSWFTHTLADEETRGHTVRVVKADRTQSCDVLIRELGIKNAVTLPRPARNDEQFIYEMTSPMRIDDHDVKTGDIKARYHSANKADHYFFAMVYLMLAFETRRSTVAKAGPPSH